ncbi:MAG: prepilin-type N-terminal cleavage/methylation domain-containing protein [Pontiellaceae bacterium]|nr:prepilin-type N-terminal cleavage/methylation domain-containing protein [Pontiellaceae bacterium]
MRDRIPSRQGMTLLEVMIAVVILAIVGFGMVTAMVKCVSVINAARHREVARGLMVQVDLENPIEEVDMSEMSDSGSFEHMEGGFGYTYNWFRNIEMVDQEERPGLFLVTTRIQWSEHGSDSYEEITEYRYAPDAEVLTSQP